MPITAKEFDAYVAKLEDHDWSFEHSDDAQAYYAGRTERKALTDAALTSRELAGAFTAYREYQFAPRMNRSDDCARRIARDAKVRAMRNRLSATEGATT